jgi:hypothetical protein
MLLRVVAAVRRTLLTRQMFWRRPGLTHPAGARLFQACFLFRLRRDGTNGSSGNGRDSAKNQPAIRRCKLDSVMPSRDARSVICARILGVVRKAAVTVVYSDLGNAAPYVRLTSCRD